MFSDVLFQDSEIEISNTMQDINCMDISNTTTKVEDSKLRSEELDVCSDCWDSVSK